MTTTAAELRGQLNATKRVVVLFRPLVDVCARHIGKTKQRDMTMPSIVDALVLSQGLYWMQRTADPDGYFYKSEHDWRKEIGIGHRALVESRKRLKARGLLNEKLRRTPPVVHYRVNVAAVENALRQSEQPVQIKSERFVQIEADHLAQNNLDNLSKSINSDCASECKQNGPDNLDKVGGFYKETKTTKDYAKSISSEPDGSDLQARAVLKTQPAAKAKSKALKERTPSLEAEHLAVLLHDLILANKPDFRFAESWRSNWTHEADYMLRIDKRDPAKAEAVIRWVQAHLFWQTNILSMGKMRKQFDRTELQMQQGKNANGTRATKHHNGGINGERSKTDYGKCADLEFDNTAT